MHIVDLQCCVASDVQQSNSATYVYIHLFSDSESLFFKNPLVALSTKAACYTTNKVAQHQIP